MKPEKSEFSADPDSPLAFFRNGIKNSITKGNTAIKDIVHALERESSEFALAHKTMNNDFRLVVDAPKNTLDAIANGDIRLTTDRAGNTFAQLLDTNGRYGKKLPIKREDFSEGIDPVQAANAIQLRAIQGQLEDIARQIAVIDVRVQEVLEGQQNDRLGLLQSGMRLYLQAREVDDDTLRKLLISQALRALSDAEAQLELKMESDVKYLANGDYEHEKGKRTKLIDERMESINGCFPAIHEASIARAAIFCEQGEPKAMVKALETYSHFIKTTVGDNAGLLAECDRSDTGTEQGIWRSRAALQLDVSKLSESLALPEKHLYLKVTDKKDESHEER
ncbi:MAG: hypothetical protein M3Z49_04055 [Bifidobacteriales bacterium]|nr:hypothetical protein [Bifidobacteriales bacterium]